MGSLAFARQIFGDVMPELRQPEIYANDPHAGLIDIAREVLGWEP